MVVADEDAQRLVALVVGHQLGSGSVERWLRPTWLKKV
jgi:hypothetical protein